MLLTEQSELYYKHGRRLILKINPKFLLFFTMAVCVLFVLSPFRVTVNVDFNQRPFRSSFNMSYNRPRSTKVTAHNHRYTINPKYHICSGKRKPFLIALIASFHPNKHMRDNIRQTWGSVAKTRKWPQKGGFRTLDDPLSVIFMFGKHPNDSWNKELEKESEQYHDVLQQDFVESYWNLTTKVLMGLKWVYQYCPRANFVMKIDEDTFLNVPVMFKHLKSRDWTNTIYGFRNRNVPVNRENGSRHFVGKDQYPYKKYPTYITGNLYVMPGELAGNLFMLSEYIPYVNIEDAHITGILANILNAKRVPVARTQYNFLGPPGVCDMAWGRKLFGQQVYPHFARVIWKTLLNPDLCKRDNVTELLEIIDVGNKTPTNKL